MLDDAEKRKGRLSAAELCLAEKRREAGPGPGFVVVGLLVMIALCL